MLEHIQALLPPCLFHKLTGYPCPGCGLTRAFFCVLRGDLRGAFYYNALSIPVFLLLGTMILGSIADSVRKDDAFARLQRKVALKKAWIIPPAATLALANWIWNIAKGI